MKSTHTFGRDQRFELFELVFQSVHSEERHGACPRPLMSRRVVIERGKSEGWALVERKSYRFNRPA